MADSPHAIRVSLNRRAKEVGLFDQELTMDELAAVRSFYDFTCLNPECGKKPATSIDHVIPLSEGGQNTLDNLQLLCTNCNKKKGAKTVDYRKGRVVPADYVAENTSEPDHKEYQDKSIDWKYIRTRYISEEIGLRELAREEHISESSILKRSARERWNEQREQYRIKITSDVITSLAAKEVDARLIAADTARAVIDSWLTSVKEEASANDALNAAKLLLLLNGDPTSRTATVDETDLDDSDIIRAAERVARRAERQGSERDYSRGEAGEDGYGAGWSD